MNGKQSTSSSHATESSSTREAVLERVGSISIPVSVQLCQRRMKFGEFVALGPGSLIPFQTTCDQPLELRVDGATIAVGEAVRCGSQLGLRLSRFVVESARR
ncbi:MAG: FliM/FliN family flagellar motor switch protein [Candidatus Saccharimonas sp.]|nr:FliM/FliN family flagellar motor switch protein [Planctomycetaceae bacterium]